MRWAPREFIYVSYDELKDVSLLSVSMYSEDLNVISLHVNSHELLQSILHKPQSNNK